MSIRRNQNYDSVTTSFVVALYLTIAVLGFLPYSISSSGFERFEPKIVSLELASLAIAFLLAIARIRQIEFKKRFVYLFIPLIAFTVLNSIIILTEEARAATYSIFIGAALAYFIGGALSNAKIEYSRITKLWPIIAGLILLGVSIYYIQTGKIDFPQEGMLKPVFPGGLVSTELSNIAAIILIALYFTKTNSPAKSIHLGVTLSGVVLCLWFFSAGTIAALMLIYMVYIPRESKLFVVSFKLMGTIIVVTLPFYILLELGIVDSIWLLRYTDDSVFLRFEIYQGLYQTAINNPLTGIGVGKFYMPPHHNLLGLAAETGFFSAGLYLVFAIGALICTYNIALKPSFNEYNDSYFYWMLWSIALFIFLKGFVHDTWQDKIFYFCLGYIANNKWQKSS